MAKKGNKIGIFLKWDCINLSFYLLQKLGFTQVEKLCYSNWTCLSHHTNKSSSAAGWPALIKKIRRLEFTQLKKGKQSNLRTTIWSYSCGKEFTATAWRWKQERKAEITLMRKQTCQTYARWTYVWSNNSKAGKKRQLRENKGGTSECVHVFHWFANLTWSEDPTASLDYTDLWLLR